VEESITEVQNADIAGGDERAPTLEELDERSDASLTTTEIIDAARHEAVAPADNVMQGGGMAGFDDEDSDEIVLGAETTTWGAIAVAPTSTLEEARERSNTPTTTTEVIGGSPHSAFEPADKEVQGGGMAVSDDEDSDEIVLDAGTTTAWGAIAIAPTPPPVWTDVSVSKSTEAVPVPALLPRSSSPTKLGVDRPIAARKPMNIMEAIAW
jgi:hypothetical protein